MEDIRHALRLLTKNPVLTLATVGTLALATPEPKGTRKGKGR